MRHRRNQRGQQLAELGITLVLFVLLVGGVMQFGHAFMVANMITHAARDGARVAASWADRGPCQQILNDGPITNSDPNVGLVAKRIAAVSGETFTVTVIQEPGGIPASPPCGSPGTTPTVKVRVQGCVPYIFNLLNFSSGCPGGFLVDRSVVFDDELRTP